MAGRRGAGHSNGVAEAIIATYRTLLRESEELLAEEDLTRPQFQALRCVAEEGSTRMKGISDKLSVTPANVTGIIDRLESKGLLKRTAHLGDRRATNIELTPKGVALQARVSSRYREFMRSSLNVLSREEQAELSEILTKLRQGMSRPAG